MENFAKILIDKAEEKGLSALEIGKELGVARTVVYDWRNGHRKCKPADLAAIAYLAGFDATQILARATADEFEGTKKGQLLARALGKTLLVTGVALAGVSAHSATTTALDTMYRLLSFVKHRCTITKHRITNNPV